MKRLELLIVMILVSASTWSQDLGVTFSDSEIKAAYIDYLSLKDALVEGKSDKVKESAKSLSALLNAIDNGREAAGFARSIAGTENLAEQRKVFTELSNTFIPVIKDSEIKSGRVYVEYCPMANSNKGGSWLSNEKEIRNPYFGSMMMTCGRVKEILQ